MRGEPCAAARRIPAGQALWTRPRIGVHPFVIPIHGLPWLQKTGIPHRLKGPAGPWLAVRMF